MIIFTEILTYLRYGTIQNASHCTFDQVNKTHNDNMYTFDSVTLWCLESLW